MQEANEEQQMSQEDRDAQNRDAINTALEEWVSPARPWATSKRVAPVLMRVLLTNKSEADDVKVWYRLGTKNPAGANVTLPLSSRKAHIGANRAIIENFLKVDPTKDYFFSDMADLEVELQATVRDPKETTGTRGKYAKRVHYPTQEVLAGTGAPDDDDDERDDDYEGYPQPQHSGYDGEHQGDAALDGLLHLRPQASPGAQVSGDRQSNGSTDAVLGNAAEEDHSQDEGLADGQRPFDSA